MKYIIYKIQIKDYIYIGSTQNFTIRKSQHKCDCNRGKDYLIYRIIRENGGWDCCTMVPVKEVDVETKLQAHILEEEMRIEYKAQMNAIRAYTTKEQIIEEKKERHKTPEYKEQKKEYRQTDACKEYNRQYQKQYRLAKKAKVAESTEIIVGV